MKHRLLCVGPAYGEIIYTTKSLDTRVLADKLKVFVSNQTRLNAAESIIGCGGGGYVAALVGAKLGIDTAFSGRVGNDLFGREILRRLKSLGVETSFSIQTNHAPTETHTYIRSQQDDFFAVNMAVPARLYDKKQVLPRAEWLYASGPFSDLRDLRALMSVMKKDDSKVCINVSHTDFVQARKMIKILSDAEICCFERDDAELLTHQSDPEEVLMSLRSSGLKTILLLDSTKAVYLLQDGYIYKTKHKSNLKQVNDIGVREVFAPAYLVAVLQGHSPEQALDFALLSARSMAHFLGSEAGILRNIPTRAGKVTKNFI